nr:sugar-binding domain-containing protein [uncultured Draconibacterium sp.]
MNLLIKTTATFFLAALLTVGWANPGKKEVKYLSGTDNENTVAWDFFCTAGRKSGVWTRIEVPSHWEQQGFGEYDYGRDYRTYGKKFEFAKESGLYKHRFNLPENWNGKRVFIVFEGSMTDTEVKINGELAGPIHQGSFYRFKYDITDKLKPNEENLLEVKVDKWSSNASVNHAERYADYWIFGGIFRPVYLEAVPQNYIDRVAINAQADGTFTIETFPVNVENDQIIEAQIFDNNDNLIQTCQSAVSKDDSLLELSCDIENPNTWTAETPNLYAVKVSLKNESETIYELTEKFGFRTIEIREGDGIYLNGTKIKMKGVNRHVFWPETGRCVNPRIDLDDVKLIKAMNMNAVRCSHYHLIKRFFSIATRWGFMCWMNWPDGKMLTTPNRAVNW